MPAYTERRQPRFLNQVSFAGRGRFRKSIYLRPADFVVPQARVAAGASPGTENTCSVGSMISASVAFDVSGSAIVACGLTNLTVPVLTLGIASPASRVWATTVIPVPPDADTSGSIVAYVDWTYGDALLQSGCKKSMTVSLAYLNGLATTPTTVRTVASAGGASVASYVGTACGAVQSTCLGKLPSFGASDSMAIVLFQLGASGATQDGTLISACTLIYGIRLEYMAKKLGRFTDE